ncbi:hypothetical protein CROQUDRAFT_652132 [Cronartium quercuum f. sp. fusiforme G11]|uniref:Uncharacterized protein n=1 Tax=Cronartium quercuum f. sp. fusiforme G11 TaxID=708437 RepID=A0A9P6NW03_9BASI|nr:hypothetical protein CROQUDRAFT_652132 [Cronartium quercuum f. sp. fusiforme G11]
MSAIVVATGFLSQFLKLSSSQAGLAVQRRHLSEHRRLELVPRAKKTTEKTSKDLQTSLTLDQSALQKGSMQDGKEQGKNFKPSLTSKNNFINFCLSPNGKVGGALIMDGKQTKTKPACNGIVWGMIPSQDKIPACKFHSPKNLETVGANKDLVISINAKNIILGHFTNPATTYFSAPAQLDPKTLLMLGHLHVVVHKMTSLDSDQILDPLEFKFFKGVDDALDKDGRVSVTIKDGLDEGFYRIATIMGAANHQPIGTSLAQRGSNDDMIYIVVKKN